MHRRTFAFAALSLLTTLALAFPAPRAASAQTGAERCLTMRLAALGTATSTSLHCHAWAVGTRTQPSAACLAHAGQQLAQRLRAAGCATDGEIEDLVASAREATAALVESQIVPSRVAELETGLWLSEAIMDTARPYQPGMPWPDLSCRAQGFCPDLMIVVCETTQEPDGSLETFCNSAPESSLELHGAPVLTTENVPLPTGEILSRGSSGGAYEAVVRLSDDGRSFTGTGYIGAWPMFLTGRRVD